MILGFLYYFTGFPIWGAVGGGTFLTAPPHFWGKSHRLFQSSVVPQGFVLGPALFLIFVADVSTIIRNFISLYADDTRPFIYSMNCYAANNLHTTTSLQ